MITWIEIVDTAVRIGLGALISGVLAYLVEKQEHKREVAKELIMRRRDAREQVAAELEATHHKIMGDVIRAMQYVGTPEAKIAGAA